MKHDPIMSPRPVRAFVLFRSGGRLDLLNPRFDCWTDEDLAHNLARISRWGGASRWHEPLSVAQHSLLVLQIREREEVLTPREALRELLHDGSEGLLGWILSVRLSPTSANLFASSSIGCRSLSASATSCRRGTPPPTAGTRRPIVSRRLLKPITSSAGAARTCAMRSASSASLLIRILFPCPASNHRSRGRRASPNRCSYIGFSTFNPEPSCTKARSRDHAQPLRIPP